MFESLSDIFNELQTKIVFHQHLTKIFHNVTKLISTTFTFFKNMKHENKKPSTHPSKQAPQLPSFFLVQPSATMTTGPMRTIRGQIDVI